MLGSCLVSTSVLDWVGAGSNGDVFLGDISRKQLGYSCVCVHLLFSLVSVEGGACFPVPLGWELYMYGFLDPDA